MVGRGHGVNAAPAGGAREEGMAQLAGGHFQRASAPFGGGFDIAPSDGDGPAQGAGLAADQLFIGVGGLAAQLVVEVRHRELPAMRRGQAMEDGQEGHRIQPAGNGDENFLAVAEELLRANH